MRLSWHEEGCWEERQRNSGGCQSRGERETKRDQTKSYNSRGSGCPPTDKTTPTDEALGGLESVRCGVMIPKTRITPASQQFNDEWGRPG